MSTTEISPETNEIIERLIQRDVRTVKVSLDIYYEFDVTGFPDWAKGNTIALEALIQSGLDGQGMLTSTKVLEDMLGKSFEVDIDEISVYGNKA